MYTSLQGAPDGRPLLLLHGGGMGGWMWTPLVAHLGPGFRLIVPDLPGHDHSADEPYRSHAATAEELRALLAEHASGRSAVVVGFSLGAQLSVLLAANWPELVDTVVVVSAQALPLRPAATWATLRLIDATAGLAARPWFARLQAQALLVPEDLGDDYLRTSMALSRASLLASVGENLRFAPPPGWARFPGRARVCVGARERRVMLRSARALHDARPGSDLDLAEGCGHGIPFQRPDWLAARIRADAAG